jgi:hypothetical protein
MGLLLQAPTSMSTHALRCEARMLLATAYARLGEHDAAISQMDIDDLPLALFPEWSVVRANHAWIRGDDATARAYLDLAQPGGDPVLQLRCFELYGWLEARAGNLASQAVILRRAFEVYAAAGFPDVGPGAWALRTLAALNAELCDPQLDDTVRYAIAALPWTDELNAEHFQVMHYLSTSETLRGSWFTALRFAREANKIAPSPAWKVTTLLDLAWIRGTLGEVRGAAADLYEALDLID